MNYTTIQKIKNGAINKYKITYSGDPRDLLQQAELLTLESIDRFQGDTDSPAFESFCKKTIYGGLAAFVLDGDVQIPAATRFEYHQILKVRDHLMEQTGLRPNVREIAAVAKTSPARVIAAIRAEILMGPAQRLDRELDGGNTVGYYLPDEKNDLDTSERKLTEAALDKALKVELDKLSITEKEVILMTLKGQTLNQIGSHFGKSEKFAREQKKNAFKKLRQSENLKGFFIALCA